MPHAPQFDCGAWGFLERKMFVKATPKQETQVKSEQRVRDHGEVLTAKREVEAMLDLVKNEAERIDSRFLEPACGDGNFLVAILERKMKTLVSRYKKSKPDFEINLISALGSIYGIDLLEDNVISAQERLLKMASDCYKSTLKEEPDNEFVEIMRFVLQKNILQGDSLNGIDKIIFTQWSLVGFQIKREEYSFSQMNQTASEMELPLFAAAVNEKGEDVFLPKPIKTFPLTNYRNLLKGA